MSLISSMSLAQDNPESVYDDFELELEPINEPQKKSVKKKKRVAKRRQAKRGKVNSLKLDPYKDIVTLQRKYLPKTERFELYGSFTYGLNNAFYNNIGAHISAGYYFTEKLGIEASYEFLLDSEREITKGLEKIDIDTRSLVIPESYYGVALKWAPIYGKLAWLNEQILHFDFYIAPSIGMTQTAIGGSELTYGFSMGQNFAISQSLAVRWDLRVGLYTAEVEELTANSNTPVRSSSPTEDVLFSVGLSYFLPEAKYR